MASCIESGLTVGGSHSRRQGMFRGRIPQGQTTDVSCGNPSCIEESHIILRPCRDNTSQLSKIIPHFVALGFNEKSGIPIPPNVDIRQWSGNMRALFHSNNKLGHFRWSMVISDDGAALVITKLGQWGHLAGAVYTEGFMLPTQKLCECGCGNPTQIAPRTRAGRGWVKGEYKRFLRGHSQRFRKPSKTTRLCACGCGEPVPLARCTIKKRGWIQGKPLRYIQFHHLKDPRRAKQVKTCPICSTLFKWQRRQDGTEARCCSRKCAVQFRVINNRLNPKKRTPEELTERGWRKRRCTVCRRFFWLLRSHKNDGVTCSRSCRSKKIMRRFHVVPRDRAILEELFIVRGMSYAQINKHFGAAECSGAAREAIKAVGLPPRRANNHKDDAPDNDHIAYHLRKGLTIAQTAGLLGCSKNHIYNVIRRLGDPREAMCSTS